ncbi:hypothetical protein VN0005_04310 [Helicobacter pylori]
MDFNDNTKLGEGKAMIDTLSNLVKIFADLSLGAHGALDDDLLGDAYEYLMRHFASESGKSKGQFTPLAKFRFCYPFCLLLMKTPDRIKASMIPLAGAVRYY